IITVRNSWLICGSPGTDAATFSPGSGELIGIGALKPGAGGGDVGAGLVAMSDNSSVNGGSSIVGRLLREDHFGAGPLGSLNSGEFSYGNRTGTPRAARYSFVSGIEYSL